MEALRTRIIIGLSSLRGGGEDIGPGVQQNKIKQKQRGPTV